jgi:hypothetical protein
MVMESRKVVGNKVDKKIKLEVKWRYDQQLNPMWHKLWGLLLKPKLETNDETNKGIKPPAKG